MKKTEQSIQRCLTISTVQKIPPHVEYTLTDLGESFMSVLEVIKQWGDLHLK